MTYYAQQSCTAGRSAFITGQLPFRTGLSKVGLPGSDLGIRKEDPTIAELLKPHGYMTGQFGKNHLGDKTFKVHLDGYNQIDYLSGKNPKGNRDEFFYFSDDGDLLAVRYQRVKAHFMIQEATGIDVWRHPFTTLRAPIFFDLEVDPFERGQEGMNYNDWWYRRAFLAVPLQNIVGTTLMTFKDFPPRQKPASFTIDQAMEALMNSTSGAGSK